MLWREDARPAQKQYADVAKAISQFEPVVMMANPEVWLRWAFRTLLSIAVISCSSAQLQQSHMFVLVFHCIPSATLCTHKSVVIGYVKLLYKTAG